jgi:hypothetical protein
MGKKDMEKLPFLQAIYLQCVAGLEVGQITMKNV